MSESQMADDKYVTVERARVYSTTQIWDALEETYYTLTWQEVAARQAEELAKMRKWQALCLDLDRCEHGRHKGDVCSSCGGPSHGNLIIGPGASPIGHGIGAEHIFMPVDSQTRFDPDEWRVKGPCRTSGPCPIGPSRRGANQEGRDVDG